MAIVRGQSTMQRVISPSSSPDASPSPPPPATPPPSPGASQQVMVSIAVAQGTAESFHRGACIANLAMSLAFAQVPSQAPLLYDSSHADAPPHTMLRHSGSLHQIAEPNKPPRRYAIVELQIQQSTVTAAPLWHMRKAPLRTATETWGPYPPYRPPYRVLPRVLKRARGAGTQPPVLRPAAHSTPRARTPPPGPPWPRHPSRHAACR